MAHEYPEHFVKRLELLWGSGFLSPGGPEEVAEVLAGIDAAGKTVLDIGCGIGGPALTIAGRLGAARVVAVDVEEALLDGARRNARDAGLESKVAFQLITPGPLPFPDASFDIVFSKEAFLHVADKPALFAEILRVLRPGGVLAASDWLRGEDSSAAWAAYQRLASYTIVPATAAQCRAMLETAGFVHVSSRDRNAWYAPLARAHLARIEGDLRASLIAASSPEIYEDWARMRRAQTDAVSEGAMRPTHLRGVRPLASPREA